MRERELIDEAVRWLRDRMPSAWSIEAAEPATTGSAIVLIGGGVSTILAVDARRSLRPRHVAGLFGSVGQTLRGLSPGSALVIAPWLSSRTRELLEVEGVNYIDLTGNARVQLEAPAMFVQTHGADRDPSPAPRGKARGRGPRAARLIRTLIDVRPPYGVRELADATGVAPGYVSRLLDAFDDDALVERTKRGQVQSVDVVGLLRRWAESYEIFASNDATPFLAPRGARAALGELSDSPAIVPVAVTGSFAAARLTPAPVAAPALLAVYVSDVDAVIESLDLIRADEGANVVLLRPFDPIVWDRTTDDAGVRYVAPSQAVVDCLTGNGRMPAEGEALIQSLLANEAAWRARSLSEMAREAA